MNVTEFMRLRPVRGAVGAWSRLGPSRRSLSARCGRGWLALRGVGLGRSAAGDAVHVLVALANAAGPWLVDAFAVGALAGRPRRRGHGYRRAGPGRGRLLPDHLPRGNAVADLVRSAAVWLGVSVVVGRCWGRQAAPGPGRAGRSTGSGPRPSWPGRWRPRRSCASSRSRHGPGSTWRAPTSRSD